MDNMPFKEDDVLWRGRINATTEAVVTKHQEDWVNVYWLHDGEPRVDGPEWAGLWARTILRQLAAKDATIAALTSELDQLREHEKQMHERLGAILGTDDSLEERAKIVVMSAEAHCNTANLALARIDELTAENTRLRERVAAAVQAERERCRQEEVDPLKDLIRKEADCLEKSALQAQAQGERSGAFPAFADACFKDASGYQKRERWMRTALAAVEQIQKERP